MSKMGDLVYIYALIDPRTDTPRYVGKTIDIKRRLRRHLYEKGKTHKHNWITSLRNAGMLPGLIVLEETNKTSWAERESWWIAEFRRQGCNLVNISDGGNGASGVPVSIETRHKISAKIKRAHAEHPRRLSDSHRAALIDGGHRAIRTQEWRDKIGRGNRGKRRTAEQREKLSQSRLGRKLGPMDSERKQKISQALSGKNNGMAKLDPDKVRLIRSKYNAGGVSLSVLGKEFGVDPKTIHRIVKGQQWTQVQ